MCNPFGLEERDQSEQKATVQVLTCLMKSFRLDNPADPKGVPRENLEIYESFCLRPSQTRAMIFKSPWEIKSPQATTTKPIFQMLLFQLVY